MQKGRATRANRKQGPATQYRTSWLAQRQLASRPPLLCPSPFARIPSQQLESLPNAITLIAVSAGFYCLRAAAVCDSNQRESTPAPLAWRSFPDRDLYQSSNCVFEVDPSVKDGRLPPTLILRGPKHENSTHTRPNTANMEMPMGHDAAGNSSMPVSKPTLAGSFAGHALAGGSRRGGWAAAAASARAGSLCNRKTQRRLFDHHIGRICWCIQQC
jgi:hypothetical protein